MSSESGDTPSRVPAIALPIATFITGLAVPKIVDRVVDKKLTAVEHVILASIACVLVILVIVAVVVSVDYRERVRERRSLQTSLDEIARKFGISVEFVLDDDGKFQGETYRRTQDLVERARKSLVFVDYWVATGDYLKGKPQASSNRDAYYDAILGKVNEIGHQGTDGPFHRRIVQMPELSEDGSPFTLARDEQFCDYMRSCLALQEGGVRASLVKVAPPYIRTHFAIIDGRHIVLPILTSHPVHGGLRRHGALVFDDSNGFFVDKLMSIYDTIDAQAFPLQEQHLNYTPAPNGSSHA